MKYDVISADCHIDLIWLPPDLFTSNASAAMKERMPYVTDGRAGQGMGDQVGRLVRADERHGLGRPPLRAGQDPPLGPDGLGGGLRRRQEGHPPHDRPRFASQGSGPRRHPGRGVVRHSRRYQPDQRRRSRRRDAAHLQRVAGAISATVIPTALPGSPASPTTTSTPRSARSSGWRGAAACAASKSPAGAT